MGDVSPIIEPGGLFHDFCPDKPLNSFLLTLHLYKLLGPPPAQQCLGTYPTLYPPPSTAFRRRLTSSTSPHLKGVAEPLISKNIYSQVIKRTLMLRGTGQARTWGWRWGARSPLKTDELNESCQIFIQSVQSIS